MPPKKRSSEVLAARGRLKGALQEIVGQTEDEQSDTNYNSSPTSSSRGRPPKQRSLQHSTHDSATAAASSHSTSYQSYSSPNRGRPPKRVKKDVLSAAPVSVQHVQQTPPPVSSDRKSFIMKLFDRSLDLAKYTENSAIYPICRAWMLNQPRSNKLINFKTKKPAVPEQRIAQHGIVEELKCGKITEINSMPAWKEKCDLERIPAPIPASVEELSATDYLAYDLKNPPVPRHELLAQLKTRSVAVRKHWQTHTKAYEDEKFNTSMRVLEYIYRQ